MSDDKHRQQMPDDPTIVLYVGGLSGAGSRQVGRIVSPHDGQEGLYALLDRAVRASAPGAKLVSMPNPERVWDTACHMGEMAFRVAYSVPPFGMANRRYAACRAVMLDHEPPSPPAADQTPAIDITDFLGD